MSVTIRGTDNSASTPAVSGTDGDTGVFFPAINTVAVATNGTEKGRFDSNGALIMGATTLNPTNANCVYIYPPDSTVRFTNTGATTREWTIGTSSPGVAAGGDYFSVTRYSGSAWSQYMNIDSAGRVITPNQPAFNANNSTNFTISSEVSITYNTAQWNTGSNYSTSTGRFTAPVAGYYLLFHKLATNSTNTFEPKIYINGTEVARAYSPNTSSNSKTVTVSTIWYMSANDYAQPYAYVPGSTTFYGAGSIQSSFYGYLLG